MEVAEILAAVLLVSLGSHIAFHAAPRYWHREQRERRDFALRRLSDLTRDIEALKRPEVLGGPSWQSAEFRHYFVPMGLRLEQARRVIREARDGGQTELSR